jgi:hypothetical protein
MKGPYLNLHYTNYFQLNKTTDNYLLEDSSAFRVQLKYLNLFWIGFIIYTLSYVINSGGFVNLKIGELLQFIGLLLLLPTIALLIKIKIENNYLRFVFFIYILWSISVILRGIQFNYPYLKSLLLDADQGGLLYLVPLILLVGTNVTFLKKLFSVIIVLGVFYLIYDVLFIRSLLDRSFETQNVVENLVRNLSMPCGFVLLTYKFHLKKRNLFAIAVMVLSVLFSIYKARRGLTSTLLLILIAAYFLYLFSTRKKLLIIYLSVLFISLGALYATSIYKISNNKLLNFIAQRGDTDTRSGVEDYFYDDLKEKDWLIGKGINGKYYCPDVIEDQLSDYRDYIETGYLQIILKGGIVRLGLFLLIALPAVILGLFSSKNILSKASALWIIIAVLSLYPATVESFNLQYLLVWISIGICYSKSIRIMSDTEMVKWLNMGII